nr:hypothetical protein [Gammaproteobacteria bacterium]
MTVHNLFKTAFIRSSRAGIMPTLFPNTMIRPRAVGRRCASCRRSVSSARPGREDPCRRYASAPTL